MRKYELQMKNLYLMRILYFSWIGFHRLRELNVWIL